MPYVDFSTATIAALSTLAALMHRRQTGEGQLIEAALLRTAVTWNSPNLIEQALLGVDRVSSHNRGQTSGPADVYRTRDGWVMCLVIGSYQFQRWTGMIGRPDLLDDERFKDDLGRGDNGEALSAYMAAWCADRTTDECLAEMDRNKVPGGPVLSPQQLLDLPHVRQIGVLHDVEYPTAAAAPPLAGFPAVLSATPGVIHSRAPATGRAHRRDPRLARLRRRSPSGACATPPSSSPSTRPFADCNHRLAVGQDGRRSWGGATMPTAPSEDVVLTWFEQLSNWHRWGPDDRLGTLNHVTPAKRVSAAGLVRDGVSVSCSWDIRTGRQPGATVENQRYMLSTGLGLADEGRKGLLGGGRAGGAQEFIGMVFHGLDVTHLDSLAHIFWDGKMYGGAPASMVSDRQGALMHDVLAVAQGVTTRGVLLDIARLRGVDVLAADDHVYPEDLEAAEQAAGVRVEPGDVVLMRTGEGGARRRTGRDYNANKPRSGYQAACLPWIHERGVAMLASDVAQDPTPTGYRTVSMPIHMVGIVAMGLWLIDNCQLEDLADTCARLGRWEFQFALAPIRFQGVTGSPVNPLAVF